MSVQPAINEFVANHTGTDTAEFIEIFGAPNTDYSAFSLLVIEGDGSGGQIDRVYQLGTTDANGLWTTGLLSNELESGTQTILLVENFTGAAGDDIDLNDDGVIDNAPWSSLVDSVAVHDGGAGDFAYGPTILTADFDGGAFTVGGASRASDGVDTDAASDWVRNHFDDIPGTDAANAIEGEANNTPGALNGTATPPAPVFTINEIDSDTAGSDTLEFIELYDGGVGNSSLDGMVVVLFNGSNDASYMTFDLTGYSTDENGFFVLGNPDVANVDLVFEPGSSGALQNGADAVALYLGTAADFPNGTAPTTTNLMDAIVYDTSDADDAGLLAGLGQSVQYDENAGGNKDFEAIARAEDGTGDFVTQAPTPGETNVIDIIDPTPASVVINEVDSDTDGTDTREFVELFDGGTGNTALDGLVVVFFNGNGDTSYAAFDLDGYSTDENGYFVLGNAGVDNVDMIFNDNLLQNGADAVAVYQGSAADFPNGTAATTTGLVDAVVYDTSDADDTGLLAALGLTTQYNESENGSPTTDSVSRVPNGTGDFVTQEATPGAANEKAVEPAIELSIHEVQGASHLSAYAGVNVIVDGIVTAVASNGFYLQEPDADADADAATSEGIFVFTGSAPTVAVGDGITATGVVEEFGFSGRLTTTQIDASDIVVNSTGNALPTATVITGQPTEAIISGDETVTDIDLTNPADVAVNIFDPENDGIDYYESIEGMYVTVEDAVSVAPGHAGYGEIWALANGGADATGLTDRGAVATSEGDLNPERIQIQIDATMSPSVDLTSIKTGDALGDVTGVISYNYGNYELIATAMGTPVDGGLTTEVSALSGSANQMTIASYNVLNLDPSDTDQIALLADQIVHNLISPDVLALQEVQDDNGSAPGTVSSAATLNALINAIDAAGGPHYSFAVVDPVAENTQGGEPNGNIRVAYLYNDERVDLVDGSLTALNEATLAAAGVSGADAFNGSRIPLMAKFLFNGEEVTVINNHFSSKSGSEDLYGSHQPFEEQGADHREAQGAALNEYVDSLVAADGGAKIVVVGDFNDFNFSKPLDLVKGEGSDQALYNQVDTLGLDEDPYSYIFQGNAQAIDQFLVTGNLVDATEFDIVHVNTDFQTGASDHDPLLGRITLGDADTPADRPVYYIGRNSDEKVLGSNGKDYFLTLGGDDTIKAFDGDDRISTGSGDDIIDAGAGNDIILAGFGDDLIMDGDGNDDVSDGFGDDTIVAGAGDDLFISGGGKDVFIFEAGSGDDEIRAFSKQSDTLDLSGTAFDFQSVSDVLAHSTKVKGGVLIDLGGDDTLYLKGFTLSHVSDIHFAF